MHEKEKMLMLFCNWFTGLTHLCVCICFVICVYVFEIDCGAAFMQL